jgi:pimeloyl-ACP methyl ester carboxylesterase
MSTDIASQAAGAAATIATRTYPLVDFAGALPQAPSWFCDALAAPHRDAAITVEGANILLRSWGEAGNPGLILVHGGFAHLGWWDFIAPLLCDHYHVVAMSLSGMGGSDPREHYGVAQHGREALAAGEHFGLFDVGQRPLMIGHSYGGFVTLLQAHEAGDRLRGGVIIDTPIKPRDGGGQPPRAAGARSYTDAAAALARFRLLPDQDCDNLFLVDHIARHALVPDPDERGRVRWGHDPALFQKLVRIEGDPNGLLEALQCPMAFFRGEGSALVTDEVWQLMQGFAPKASPFVSIPDARHHVMLDQPLAIASALRALLAVWPSR